jgi:Zn-dependent protease
MDFSNIDLRLVVVNLITLVLSITVHEFGHAIVADRLGDRLPRSQGRVTLNPLAHADPIGTLALPAFFMLSGLGIGFGWGRPVMVNPGSFSRRFTVRTAHLLVAAAGPAMNLLFGIAISLLLFALYPNVIGVDVARAMYSAVQMNFVLMFFNLIPFAPLDGGTVLAGLLPRHMLPAWENISRFGMFIVVLFMIPPMNQAFLWPARKLLTFWMGLLGL